jgi:predicted transglutaminase-like cysteine proteinase
LGLLWGYRALARLTRSYINYFFIDKLFLFSCNQVFSYLSKFLFPLVIVGCTSPQVIPEIAFLESVNRNVNQQGHACPRDYCISHWPDESDLNRLHYWDCKAYAVAKAGRLMRDYGYSPERLEYILIAGDPLRVTHAALLVDGVWVLDQGVRCDVCDLEKFADGFKIVGRLKVGDLKWIIQVLQK